MANMTKAYWNRPCSRASTMRLQNSSWTQQTRKKWNGDNGNIMNAVWGHTHHQGHLSPGGTIARKRGGGACFHLLSLHLSASISLISFSRPLKAQLTIVWTQSPCITSAYSNPTKHTFASYRHGSQKQHWLSFVWWPSWACLGEIKRDVGKEQW